MQYLGIVWYQSALEFDEEYNSEIFFVIMWNV